MRRWELWESETGHVLVPEDDPQGVVDAIAEGCHKTWECVAKGSNDAMRQMYVHLGYGDYRPMLGDDGKPYPADEDDAYQPRPS